MHKSAKIWQSQTADLGRFQAVTAGSYWPTSAYPHRQLWVDSVEKVGLGRSRLSRTQKTHALGVAA